MALDIIREQIAENEAFGRPPRLIFPEHGARAAVTGEAVAKAVHRHNWGIPHWTPHDLRRTAATEMERAGVSPFIIGHVLNHVSATKATVTSRIYARYTYEKEKRDAVDLWAGKLAGILTGAKVVPLRAAG
jgi:integrase